MKNPAGLDPVSAQEVNLVAEASRVAEVEVAEVSPEVPAAVVLLDLLQKLPRKVGTIKRKTVDNNLFKERRRKACPQFAAPSTTKESIIYYLHGL